eukprot:gnl/Chilomastix_cuspidata/3999.p1 GENE.gnl/Chilomastix_cuspidata/3999~~gnl/Chilomastix_cuspidata/3999.p1  ORF type:complete len:651 (-),score=61.56 gnl/Chilomastix_cuspidata/3999:1953-3905(-)
MQSAPSLPRAALGRGMSRRMPLTHSPSAAIIQHKKSTHSLHSELSSFLKWELEHPEIKPKGISKNSLSLKAKNSSNNAIQQIIISANPSEARIVVPTPPPRVTSVLYRDEDVMALDMSNQKLVSVPKFTNCQWRRLNLAGNRIVRIENLRLLRSLKHLDISNNRVASLRPIATQAPNLRVLIASGNNISDFQSTGALRFLEVLDLRSNRITVVPPRPMLRCLGKLQKLDLAFNSLSSIANLSFLPSLQILDLQGNQLRRITELEAPALRWLSLAGNYIADVHHIAPVFTVPRLAELFLGGNPMNHRPGFIQALTELTRAHSCAARVGDGLTAGPKLPSPAPAVAPPPFEVLSPASVSSPTRPAPIVLPNIASGGNTVSQPMSPVAANARPAQSRGGSISAPQTQRGDKVIAAPAFNSARAAPPKSDTGGVPGATPRLLSHRSRASLEGGDLTIDASATAPVEALPFAVAQFMQRLSDTARPPLPLPEGVSGLIFNAPPFPKAFFPRISQIPNAAQRLRRLEFSRVHLLHLRDISSLLEPLSSLREVAFRGGALATSSLLPLLCAFLCPALEAFNGRFFSRETRRAAAHVFGPLFHARALAPRMPRARRATAAHGEEIPSAITLVRCSARMARAEALIGSAIQGLADRTLS